MTRRGPYGRRGQAIRVAYLVVSMLVWIAMGFGRRGRGGVVVLCYHGVRDDQAARFRRQVRRVAARAIGSWELQSVSSRRGRAQVCITFDDAFANLLRNALPALAEHGAPATIFAVSRNLGAPPRWAMPPGHPDADEQTMTAEEISSCACSLVRIGSHTRTHPRLTSLDGGAMREELQESRAELASIVGSPVTELAFPHGDFDERALRAAQVSGYERVFTLELTPYPGPSPSFVTGRFSADPDMWTIEFLLTCDGAYAWLEGCRRLLRRLRGRTPTHMLETAS